MWDGTGFLDLKRDVLDPGVKGEHMLGELAREGFDELALTLACVSGHRLGEIGVVDYGRLIVGGVIGPAVLELDVHKKGLRFSALLFTDADACLYFEPGKADCHPRRPYSAVRSGISSPCT